MTHVDRILGPRAARRYRSYVVLTGVLGIVAVTLACGGGQAPPGGPPQMPPTPVEAVTIQPAPIEQSGEFVATVKSRRSTTIQPQAEGFLTRILVKSGDRVVRGTPLFEIDAAMQQAAVGSLESIRAAREADVAYARQQAQRAKTLLDVGAMSQQEFEQATTLLKTAEAQLKAIDEQIKQQKTELGYFRVAAPAAGVVGDVPVRQGDRVTRTTVLTTVDDNTGLEVYIQVPVQEAPRLKVGLPVRIVDEAGVTMAAERINFIAPSVDDETQTVLVKTPLQAQGRTFRTDQFVRARIIFSTDPGVTVPVVSLARINGMFFAFTVDADKDGKQVARQKAVTVGPVIGNNYVILDGLKAGDRLIVSGIQKIGDGAPVVPQAPKPAPADGRGGGS